MVARTSGKTPFLESLALRCARRPWTTIGIWVLVIIIALALESYALRGRDKHRVRPHQQPRFQKSGRSTGGPLPRPQGHQRSGHRPVGVYDR